MEEDFTMQNLVDTFNDAIEFGVKYIGVKIQMDGFEKPEIIINERENFQTKLAYYQNAYNKDLTLKARSTIRIVECTYGDSFSELELGLVD